MSLTLFRLAKVQPETGAPPAERIIAGDPRHTIWTITESPDGRLFSGVWESTPGAWRVAYDEWEFCEIVAGVSVLTPDGGAPATVRAGDAFVIEPGFAGIWEVVETTRKHFVVRL